MTDDELRALVRESIARALGTAPVTAPTLTTPATLATASHYRYALPPSDGPCVIEPSVPCTHCGYCQSHGH